VLTDFAGAILELYAFDAYGNAIGFDPSVALTEFLYSGEQFDSKIGQQYLRQRYYDPATGRFNRLDPFFGNLTDPQSLHKYLYTHADPVNGIDPSGNMTVGMAISIAVNVGKVAATGAIIGVGVNIIRNLAVGNAWYHGTLAAAESGAVLLPLIALFPPVGLTVATLGIIDTIQIWRYISSQPNPTITQYTTASVYTLLNMIFFWSQARRTLDFTPVLNDTGIYASMLLRPTMPKVSFFDRNGFEVMIYGQSRYSSTTEGHAATIDSTAIWLAQTEKIATIFKGRSVRTALLDEGRTTWLNGETLPENQAFLRLIPDVVAISKEGKVYLFEVKSNTDTVEVLRTKLETIYNEIPIEQRGGIDILLPGQPPSIPIE
ncbi:MAG: RHS repeat-associated core domain-containing protein, partial [Bacteroidales bacterium]|nr:RHS repeat-associated core domain-containing protein [Bacteroidales bacterium]